MEDIIDLISEFDSRIKSPEEFDDIKELTAVRDALVGHVISKYKAGMS